MSSTFVRFGTVGTLAIAFLLAACSSEGGPDEAVQPSDPPPSNPPSAGEGAVAGEVTYAGVSYPIVAGQVEEYRSESHSRVDATFTDGAFFPIVVGNVTFWSASSERAEWYAELFSPGRDGFRDGTFEHVANVDGAIVDPAARSTFFFGNAYVAIDQNGNGQVDDDENIDVAGGTISVRANGRGGVQVELDVMLVDGQRVAGRYDGAIGVIE